MAYRIELKPSAVRSLSRLPEDVKRSIARRLDGLTHDPFPSGVKKLAGEEKLYRLRVGDYRIIYQVKTDVLLVLVLVIGHRKGVYRRIPS